MTGPKQKRPSLTAGGRSRRVEAIRERDAASDIESRLVATVQYNSSVSDAVHARDFSLCTYLLRMREYYRWQSCVPFGVRLSMDEVGDWVATTEGYWDTLEDKAFGTLCINGRDFDPFDAKGVNGALKAIGVTLGYSAGVGLGGQPQFLLARLEDDYTDAGVRVQVFGTELARGIATAPGMSSDQVITVRRDGVRRLLWEAYEDWSFQRRPGPMARLNRLFGLGAGTGFEARLDRAARACLPVVLAHERGEVLAANELPAGWQEMMAGVLGGANEYYARAVRDNLADSLATWPMIVETQAEATLDFWLLGRRGIRKELLDRSCIKGVFDAQSTAERMSQLGASCEDSAKEWKRIAGAFVAAFERDGVGADFAKIPG